MCGITKPQTMIQTTTSPGPLNNTMLQKYLKTQNFGNTYDTESYFDWLTNGAYITLITRETVKIWEHTSMLNYRIKIIHSKEVSARTSADNELGVRIDNEILKTTKDPN
jgi:hypothetical protein